MERKGALLDNGFERELDLQVSERIALMEGPGYEFPQALGKADWTFIVIVPAVSLCLLALGAVL
ncbi:MAG: hypothetical protein SOW20_06560 [Berryella intestinalis]|uniref:hypothetical protein n=1 Tax=Berryella intestinalis TaxID=1531429 RepID=UPI002A51E21A|nr:hypothetical protein [Berryella intestinalis]MDD7369010.1 hypothetical protein [Berryella intestinalis]MDY3129667.1 hypothetical protein [Berryella intestinalis]